MFQERDSEGRFVKQPIKHRFWKYAIKKDGCWGWSGAKSRGYGKLDNEGAHRVSYQLHIGEIPSGLFVCHKCDNRECTNPKHLWLGTQKDNIKDMFSKNRGNTSHGEEHYRSKLSLKEVEKIRKEYLSKRLKQIDIAKKYGVDQSAISRIINNKIYVSI